jgi:stage V sporulation protein D (sporulation-specific penicillin-binding protein)
MMVLFGAILALLCGLIGRLMYIEYTNGSNYEKKVLSMQSYDSQTIPFQRGDIVDSNGTVLATSVAVYNVILDCSVMTDKEEYIEPTINALVTCFPDLDKSELESYATDKADSKYIVLEKKLEYSAIQGFQDKADNDSNIQGVWFEKEYQRTYPFNTLAASVIGFTSSGDVGTTGLENYYDDELNGVDGREYGYLDADSDFEKTVIAAEDGNTIVTSIDANIQSIVEKKIEQFNEKYRNNYYDDAGSVNTAVLIMNPNTGEILAMADYPEFDLNNPRDLSGIYSEDEIADMSDDDQMDILNSLWQNYCVTATYEPGSVQKPFTVACGLETGKITDNMTFNCDGGEQFDSWISCVARSGHGLETVRSTLMDSCNDAIMQMTYKIGKANFLTYQSEFGFGQKTGIDLPGEANTSTLVYTEENMKAVDLATNAFGQNYNCTMVQVASAFSSLINGGNYYEPHLVTKITDSSGNTLETIEPKLVKQTVSESTSSQVKDYLYSVVTDGTGNTAKVDGYSMGGKTGTAQKLPRGNGKYLVSFIGFAPYDDPELVIYCIVDEPNAKDEAHSYYAQNIVREILEEVLPYMNIYRDEEKTGVNKGLDVTGVDEQYTGNNNGRVKR